MEDCMKSSLIQSETDASKLAYALVARSLFFSIEPLPDDIYRISVKPEAEHVLRQTVRDLGIRFVNEFPKYTIRGIECFLDSRLNQITPVDYPEITVNLNELDYSETFKSLPRYTEEYTDTTLENSD
jgi:hypothetical protein